MSRQSTVSKGNVLRDEIAQLLRSAGYANVATEVYLRGKKVDVVADSPGLIPTKIAFEAKDYHASLSNHDASQFVYDYGPLLQQEAVAQAILISRGSITPAAMDVLTAQRTRGMTFEDFRRSVWGAPEYLSDLTAQYISEDIDNYYVPARIIGQTLSTYVHQWLTTEDSRPLAVLGGYGSGKTTFASWLCGTLARGATTDPTARIPVRIKLGDLTEQTSLEGLFGAHFTAAHNIRGYSWRLFRELNRQGKLLIIFDGFDEMKHGMTYGTFQRQFDLLMSLVDGRSKIIILGRHTAFKDDTEFRAIIKGKRRTPNGLEIQSTSRPECIDVYLEPFNPAEARTFIDGFFPRILTQQGLIRTKEWISGRLASLHSPTFSDLIIKPVHAQMLCMIASQDRDFDVSQIDQFSLYDQFVAYLLERETEKQGRYGPFNVEVRRRANSALAWWLFSQDGASTTSVLSAPMPLFSYAAGQIEHEFDEEGLKRELAQGCLIDKNNDIVYFGHRSIQEFLSAEHLFDTMLNPLPDRSGDVGIVCRWTTDQTNVFLHELFNRRSNAAEISQSAMKAYEAYRSSVDIDGLQPFISAYQHARGPSLTGVNGIFLEWLSEYSIQEGLSNELAFSRLLFWLQPHRSDVEYLAALYLLRWCVSEAPHSISQNMMPKIVAALVDPEEVSRLVESSYRSGRLAVNSRSMLRTHTLLALTQLRPAGESILVDLSFSLVDDILMRELGYVPTRSSKDGSMSIGNVIYTCSAETVIREIKPKLSARNTKQATLRIGEIFNIGTREKLYLVSPSN